MTPRAFKIQPADNVATLIDDAKAGPVDCLGAGAGSVSATEPIVRGHKIALAEIRSGDPVIKFGVRIGHATGPIPQGAWVHLHNLASDCDARSGTLDPLSGAPTDTSPAYA